MINNIIKCKKRCNRAIASDSAVFLFFVTNDANIFIHNFFAIKVITSGNVASMCTGGEQSLKLTKQKQLRQQRGW